MKELATYNQKIRAIRSSQEFDKSLKRELLGVLVDNGLGEVDELVMTRRIEYIKTHYCDLTLPQIREAFQLNTTGKWKQVEHYSAFDNAYIGGVLNKYKEYLRSSKLKSNLRLAEPKEISKEALREKEKEAFMTIQSYVDQNTKLPAYSPYGMAYNYAEREGLISLTDEEKEMFQETVKAELEEEDLKDKNSESPTVRNAMRSLNIKHDLKYECRRRYMKKYFENLITEKK